MTGGGGGGERSLSLQEIKAYQCNRYPVLLIDRVDSVTPGKSVRARKNFSYNEWFFQGHFEDEPSVPGFVQIECLVQAFIMTFLTLDGFAG